MPEAIDLTVVERAALGEAMRAAIQSTIEAVWDPDPSDLAEAAMDALINQGIIRVPGEGTHSAPAFILTTEADRVVLVTKQAGDTAVTLNLSVEEAERLHMALPLHINAARGFRNIVAKHDNIEQEG